jgi:hypothetical protein
LVNSLKIFGKNTKTTTTMTNININTKIADTKALGKNLQLNFDTIGSNTYANVSEKRSGIKTDFK